MKTMLGLAASVLIASSPLLSQSFADVARASRPKDAKITTKRVWTDDDVGLGDYGQPMTKVLTSPTREIARSKIDIRVKSPDQLGFECFGNRQWPDATIWQEKLWIAYSWVLDAAHDYNSNPTATALTDMLKAQTAFTATHERCGMAVKACDAKNDDSSRQSK